MTLITTQAGSKVTGDWAWLVRLVDGLDFFFREFDVYATCGVGVKTHAFATGGQTKGLTDQVL